MDNPTSQRKISKGREKSGHRKLYTQPCEPVISLSSCHGVSGSSRSPGMKGNGSTAGIVPSKTQQSLKKKHKHKEEDFWGSDHDVFVRPKVTRRRKLSSSSDEKSLASRLPQCHSPLQRQKLRQSLSRTSPRGNFSGAMKRLHTVSMTRNDMKKLQEAVGDNQRKKKKKNVNGMAQIDSSPFKVPHPKKGEKEVEAVKQIKRLKRLSYQKRDQSLEVEEPDMYKEIAIFKQKENTVSSHVFTPDVSGKHDSKPNKDFQRLDGMYNPSQELFTDIESGNETDTRAIVQRTVSRFLSSQDAQNDFRTPNCRMVQRTSHVAGVLDSESQVSESSEDEASETVLEKEVRSFFESKKKHSPTGHREVAPASEMAQTHIQAGVVDLGMSDESEIICAGQEIRSQIENDNVMDGDDTDLGTPDSNHNREDRQILSDDTSSTYNQGVAKGDIVFEQQEKRENNAEDIASEEDKLCTGNQLQTTSQTDSDVEMASLSEEVDNSPLTGIESGELGETSHLLFHSTPADPIRHPKQQKAQAPTAVPTSLIQTEKDMFQLYCHKETAPRILEALKMCENIDGSTLASRNLDDGPTRLEVICGKVFEDEAERTSFVSSPVLFDENSDEVDGMMEMEGVDQMSKQAIKDSTKKKGKDMLPYDAKTKPKLKKGKKKKKRKKVLENPGDNLVKTRLKVICGPIKGDARKKNEHRWIRETREQSKCHWSEITVEPSLESDLGMLRCLKAAARAALKQRETPQDRDANLEEDDPDLGTFVNLVSFPDVFMTKKKDQPSFRKVPPSEIQVLDGF